jgi:hypothetical protein
MLERTRRVSIPVDVLELALRKARIEYVRLAQLQGTDPGEEWETWAELSSWPSTWTKGRAPREGESLGSRRHGSWSRSSRPARTDAP